MSVGVVALMCCVVLIAWCHNSRRHRVLWLRYLIAIGYSKLLYIVCYICLLFSVLRSCPLTIDLIKVVCSHTKCEAIHSCNYLSAVQLSIYIFYEILTLFHYGFLYIDDNLWHLRVILSFYLVNTIDIQYLTAILGWLCVIYCLK